MRNGIAWQLLPAELGFGSGQTCWRRLERWQRAGVWASPPPRGPPRRQGLRLQPQPRRTTQAPDPAGHLPQGLPEHQRPGHAPLRRRADLALLHQFKRLAVRWERRTELHNAFASLACSLICRRRLEKTSHDRHEL
ncbi:transposase [Streptomyces sp. RK31]|nr:transposase [Streptomyces sp. RK31]